MSYNISNQDNVYLDKNLILSIFTQEQIFSLVFDEIVLYRYITSPFREDSSPGCWFEYYNDKLYFTDFGSGGRPNLDCFDVVQKYFNLRTFKDVLNFILDNKNVIQEKNLAPLPQSEISNTKKDKKILIKTRNWHEIDKNYWKPYGINKKHLQDDSVFPVDKIIIKNFDTVQTEYITNEVCYAFTDFSNNDKKLYFPYKKEKRFISTCNKDAIGSINFLNPFLDKVVITKSYKDCRVLRNHGVNSVWFQNEGCLPSEKVLASFLKNYSEIIIFFDNDNAGKKATETLVEYLKTFNYDPYFVFIKDKNYKDISSLYLCSPLLVEEFISNNNLD
jgi:5S rRNA maturation endonuclease (ribonuclease M5)